MAGAIGVPMTWVLVIGWTAAAMLVLAMCATAAHADRVASRQAARPRPRRLPAAVRFVPARLAAQAKALLDVQRVLVFANDPHEPQRAVIVAGVGVSSDVIGGRVASDTGPLGRVIASGRPVMVEDHAALNSDAAHTCTAGFRASVCVPIVLAGTIRGALAVASTDAGRRFRGREVDALADLARAANLGEPLDPPQREALQRASRTTRRAANAAIAALALHDPDTAEHCLRVAGLARRLGEQLELSAPELDELELAGVLHDIGKLRLPTAILRKQGRLTDGEWQLMHRHPTWGAELVAELPGLRELAPVVAAHHERHDGHGYPNKLAGPDIPLPARIIAAADACDAMTAQRPYRPAVSRTQAARELRACAGTQFDPDIAERLHELLLAGPAPAAAAA